MKLKGRVIILIVLLLIIGTVCYLVYREGTLPVDKSNKQTKIFVIKKGENVPTIADHLERDELIRNKIVFFILTKQLHIEKNIQAGDYRLSSSMNLKEIAINLTHGSLDNWITIIEGLRKEQIAQILSSNLNVPESEFNNISQEGHLFPDTYLIPNDATPAAVINIFTKNFNKRFAEAKALTPKKNNLTDDEILTLASIVERETIYDEDRLAVAKIFLKRIKEGHRLQTDVTVQYALGYQPQDKTWWKKEISIDDTKVDSPYNTYLVDGLPPGPICNPGIASIKAALAADANSPYLFFLADKKGKLHFAKNLDEHQRNIDKYLK